MYYSNTIMAKRNKEKIDTSLGKSHIKRQTELQLERGRMIQLQFSYKGKTYTVNDNVPGIMRRKRLITRDGGVILTETMI